MRLGITQHEQTQSRGARPAHGCTALGRRSGSLRPETLRSGTPWSGMPCFGTKQPGMTMTAHGLRRPWISGLAADAGYAVDRGLVINTDSSIPRSSR